MWPSELKGLAEPAPPTTVLRAESPTQSASSAWAAFALAGEAGAGR